MSQRPRISVRIAQKECNGCLSCTIVCSMANERYASPSAARMRVDLDPFGGNHSIAFCRQCGRAPCAETCPVKAIVRSPDGWWAVDQDLCQAAQGCRKCVEVCPFDAMFWNPISERIIKCELCGGDPQCAAICQTGALRLQAVTSAPGGPAHSGEVD